MMNMKEINEKVLEIKEMQRIAEQANAVVESLKDELKALMDEQNITDLDTGVYHLRYTNVSSTRLDSKKVQELSPEVYQAAAKTSSSRRFSIN